MVTLLSFTARHRSCCTCPHPSGNGSHSSLLEHISRVSYTSPIVSFQSSEYLTMNVSLFQDQGILPWYMFQSENESLVLMNPSSIQLCTGRATPKKIQLSIVSLIADIPEHYRPPGLRYVNHHYPAPCDSVQPYAQELVPSQTRPKLPRVTLG